MDDPFGIEKMGGGNSKPPQHKEPKPRNKIGRGRYVNAPGKPHWHQNVHRPKFVANALINNPDVGAALAGGAVAGGALSQRDKASEKGKQHIDEGAGAAAGAGVGMGHAQHKGFKVKAWTQDPKNNTDWQKPGTNNPMPGPHKKKIVDLQRASRKAAEPLGGSKRAYQEHYNAHFPEGLKTTKARRWLSNGHGKYTAGAMLVGAGAGAGVAFGAHKAKEHYAKKHDPVQDEIDRRKKLSAASTRVSSTGGLLAVGALGAGALAPHGVGTPAGKLINLTEKGAREFKHGTRAHATGLTVVSGGIGGLNGFNNAKIQSMEASQRKKKAAMIKSHSPSPFEDGYYGEVSKYYDPEENRKKRADLYENAASATAGAAAAGAVHQGVKAGKTFKGSLQHWGGKKPLTVMESKHLKTVKVKGGRAALLAGTAGAAAYGAKKIHDKKDNSWQPYSKALGGTTPGMGAMRPAPSAAKFKPLGQRPVSANVKNMRKVPLANGGGPSGGGGGGVGNTAGLSGVGKSADFGIFND